MGYTYTTYALALRTMIASAPADLDFPNILPSVIDYAEQRIYRELNLLSTVTVDNTNVTTVVGTRELTIPDSFVVVNNINLFTPAGAVPASGGRKPLTPVSRDVIDMLWPSSGVQGVPEMFSMTTQWTMVLGPSPDGLYRVEIVGTQRPDPLSAINPTTFLSERLPDLFLAASLIFLALYMRNFSSAQGQSGNDPLMSGNWEAQYGLLKGSADLEELRKSFQAASWTSRPVSPAAEPQRG